MLYINGFIGCVLLLIGLVHVPFPMPFSWAPYLVGAALALITLKSEISIPLARLLAIGTAVAMFFFFAGFFVGAPKLAADWYTRPEGWDAVGRIIAAFLMLPILSEYSCRLKAERREAIAHERQRRYFFSAPEHAPNQPPPP